LVASNRRGTRYRQIYLDYEHFGESALIGFPTQPAQTNHWRLRATIPGRSDVLPHRRNQRVTKCTVPFSRSFLLRAASVHVGYPITHETDLKRDGAVIGKFSEFENCTIYWSAGTGAFEVHGDIRVKYKEYRGSIGIARIPDQR